jgi:hypothetical protein
MEGYLRENLFKSIIEQTAGFAALLEAGQNRPISVSESGADYHNDDNDNDNNNNNNHNHKAL